MTSIVKQIKWHGWHNVELNGDLLTGETYKVKDFITKNLGGKWDKERKGWVVDLEKVAKYNRNGTLMIV